MLIPLLFQEITEKPVTITTTVGQLLSWIIVGLLAGLLASLFIRGRISITGVIVIGLLGAVIGGYIFFDLLDIVVTGALADGIMIRWIDIIVAFIGSLLILSLTSLYWRRI